MTFPSIDSAIGYVESKLGEFYRQGDVLVARLRAVTKLIQQAKETNDQEAMGRLIVMQSQVKSLLQDQIQLEQTLKPFAQAFGVSTPQLGLFPLVLAGAAVGVASMLYLHFEKIQNQKTALDLIAKGMLKPSEAQAILEPGILAGMFGGGLGSMWVYLLLGGGAYLYFTTKRS